MSAARPPGILGERTISGYDDGFAFTAPVGSFPPNGLGIYELSGNVQEWVEDEYSKLGSNSLGVLRGGGWNTYQTENLYTGSRNAVPPDYRDEFYGFRIVLAKVPQETD
jgi:formylglycine-generating enzyme required for sulfatase activity